MDTKAYAGLFGLVVALAACGGDAVVSPLETSTAPLQAVPTTLSTSTTAAPFNIEGLVSVVSSADAQIDLEASQTDLLRDAVECAGGSCLAEILAEFRERVSGMECSADDVAGLVGEGTQVVLTSADGTTIGLTELDIGSLVFRDLPNTNPSAWRCEFPFAFPDIEEAQFYSLEIPDLGYDQAFSVNEARGEGGLLVLLGTR